MLSKYKRSDIIDVGSNIGSTSLALMHFDKDVHVYSFEAQSFLANLQKNTMLVNDYSHRITIYNNAVGHKCIQNVSLSSNFNEIDSIDGSCNVINYNDQMIRNYGGVNLGKGGEVIDMVNLDLFSFNNVSLIKIDVEGAEKLVIYGARKTIQKHKPVIFYEDNWKQITPEMIETLKLTREVIDFDISEFLKSVGYSKCEKIDDNWLWIY